MLEDSITGYLRRLGVGSRPAPCLETLSDLMSRHMQTVPFENLDIIAGTPRSLSTESVVRKVLEGRGGFCYELNEAFRALLEHLGFRVRRIEARVWQARANRFGPPFDHLALLVALPEGEHLVDVGFGDSNRAPLPLPDGRTADISGEYRLRTTRPGFLELASQTEPLYEMTLTEQPLHAFADMCRFHQRSPESVFAKGLICTRATDTGRITLSGDRLIVMDRGRRTESVPTDVRATLRDCFKIADARPFGESTMSTPVLPADPGLRIAFEEALAGYHEGGLPIGAALFHRGELIARGRNRRVQDGNPILHAEMTCFQNAGRLPSSVYREATLYSTLSPCYMCSGAALLFGVPRMVVGESRTILAADDWLRSRGMTVTVADDPACYELLEKFRRERPEIWAEDIGDAGTGQKYFHSHNETGA